VSQRKNLSFNSFKNQLHSESARRWALRSPSRSLVAQQKLLLNKELMSLVFL